MLSIVVCLGDFNVVGNPEEKMGGRMFSGMMIRFDAIISELNLIDPELMEAKYT